jgi:hypothetical protein
LNFKCKKIKTILKLIVHETYYISQNILAIGIETETPEKALGMFWIEELQCIARPEKWESFGEGIAQKIDNMSLCADWCFI